MQGKEPLIVPQSPPVNSHAHKQVLLTLFKSPISEWFTTVETELFTEATFVNLCVHILLDDLIDWAILQVAQIPQD